MAPLQNKNFQDKTAFLESTLAFLTLIDPTDFLSLPPPFFVSLFYGCLGQIFFTVLFAYAAFTVSRLRDIWDLDKMFSHRFCPNKTFIVSIIFLLFVLLYTTCQVSMLYMY